MATDKPNPGTKSSEYQAQEDVWSKIQTLLDGTSAMRASGERFLPRHEQESSSAYQTRLEMTTLRNLTQLTLDTWVGYPFSNPVQIGKETPESESVLLKNVDLQGNDVTVFAREVFRIGLAKRVCHVLVEHPSKVGVETLADQRAAKLRPYWCLVQPENLYAAYYATVNGQKVLTHARIGEFEVEYDGTFGERYVHRVRVFDRLENGSVTLTIYEWQEKARGRGDWVQTVAPVTLGIKEIPIVTFEADPVRPPLEDVADLNIQHWQSSSDQRNVLTVARFPMLAASGIVESESNAVIGPKQLLLTSDPNGRYYYVEHGGAAIGAGRQDLIDLEDCMAAYGAQYLVKKSGNTTATGEAIDSAQSTSRLQDAVIRFNDFLARLLDVTVYWQGEKEAKGTISVGTDFGPALDAAGLGIIDSARKGRDLSRNSYIKALQDYGVLSKTFDAVENEAELEGEDMTFGGKQAGDEPIHNLGEEDEKPSEGDNSGGGSSAGLGLQQGRNQGSMGRGQAGGY